MGARKGQNNFASHHERLVATNLLKVRRALGALSRRTRYADFPTLSRAVALAAGIHPTTLARNRRYLKEVWAHVQANPGIIVGLLDEKAPVPALKVKTVEAEIEAASLRRHNARLRKAIEMYGAQHGPVAAPAAAHADPDARERDFAKTATVLARLLNRLADKELGIVLDARRGAILDTAEDGDAAVVAGRPDTTPFLDWMQRQKAARRITHGEDS
ncbi:hypothetical protein SAMN05216360_102223 [Methylobacterium phyllostachyos]|uniref:Uncharacterized protein n=1 Tax=Methylobacterium phyllostachyos TaxID=582672 RepID=A0A1G9TKQ7_9HYPH|nr:hypothetical protein [Methylobacterium phyllostachyos]SDM48366.1 hypothetical protein SAMN05216360_102223 [Methylobacterium phyllostachyos]